MIGPETILFKKFLSKKKEADLRKQEKLSLFIKSAFWVT